MRRLIKLLEAITGYFNKVPKPENTGDILADNLEAGSEPVSGEGVALLPTADLDYSKLSGTILYIDDNLINLQLMQSAVGLCSGLTLISAHNAELGLMIAGKYNPDLIILDINLPGMSGLEALEKLREMNVVPGIPAIALSAASTEEDIKIGLEAGFQAYLTKPMDIEELLNTIKSILAS